MKSPAGVLRPTQTMSGLNGCNLRLELLEFGWSQGTEGGSVGERQFEAGETWPDRRFGKASRTGAAIEKCFHLVQLRGLANLKEKIGSVHAIHFGKTGQCFLSRPWAFHPVCLSRRVQDGAKCRVGLCLGNAMHRR